MGAELIGYLLVGDKDLSQYRDAAIAQAEKFLAIVKSGHAKFIDGELATPLSGEESDYFTFAFPDIDINVYPEMLKDKLDFILDEIGIKLAESVVDDFLYFWKYPHNRDTNYRFHNGKQIVFAGGESHGDEPSGFGYNTLKLADMLGLFPACNIE